MENALAIVRFGQFLSLMLVFGAASFLIAFAPPGLRLHLSRPLRRAAVAAAAVAVLTGALWLSLEGAAMSGDWRGALDPATLLDVVGSTDFGAVWSARLPLLLALLGLTLVGRPARWRTIAFAALLCLASLGLVGHAAMQTGGIGIAHRVNDGAHLVTCALWIGGLPPFLLSLAAFKRDDLRDDAAIAMHRFSTVGHIVVVAIVLTGAANIALTTGHAPWPPNSAYRTLLLAKLFDVFIMICMAILNRYILTPRLEQSRSALAALRASSLIETGLGWLVVALVSLFGLLDPA